MESSLDAQDAAFCSGLELIAITVSRVEAATLASMLGAYGVATHIDGFWHASVSVNSQALGGHRIYVARADYGVASDLIREVGCEDSWEFSFAARRAVLRFLLGFSGLFAATTIPAVLLGVMDWKSLWLIPGSALEVRVNPQGRPDYFLAP